jgi:hypothetical protein
MMLHVKQRARPGGKMSDPLKLTTVPRDLYYHEIAYVRGLEAENERLNYELYHYDEMTKAFHAGNKLTEELEAAVQRLTTERDEARKELRDLRETLVRRALEEGK